MQALKTPMPVAFGSEQAGSGPFIYLDNLTTVELSEFIKEKHNVHQAIKNMIRGIRVLYNRSQEEEGEAKQKPKSTVPIVP